MGRSMGYQRRGRPICRGWRSLATFVVIFLRATTCKSQTNQTCPPSSCGLIRNIRSPFRLKTDPTNCGNPSYELECENNHTLLYFNSKKFSVMSITYENYTIRLLDPGISKNQCPSFPVHSLTYYDIPKEYTHPMEYEAFRMYSSNLNAPGANIRSLNTPVMFLNCSNRVESSRYVDTATCSTETSSNTSSSPGYSYVLLGNQVTIADVEDSCKINKVAWASEEFAIIDNTSFSSILDALANGFSLHWFSVYCENCGSCYLDDKNYVKCGPSCAFEANMGKVVCEESCFPRPTFSCLKTYLQLIFSFGELLFVLLHTVVFLCGLPCFCVLLHYKYRAHHLESIYDSIESFLRGQNDLVPIRYKYKDVRKITNNFREKLGEGGYGSVFKGKLRSGIFVAVKMMNKSTASGQDFINEVGTIGRIHHVNVVRLIGFFVEGSKRGLIYEFMPNGSLEKHIFSQVERNISLSYEKMFEISLGVARGIEYLHRGCDMQILHFDIKPHNILLDGNFTPKISDFGLARLYPTEDSIVSLTGARGTIGYMAPELFYQNIGRVSYKADIYSYGMLLMEMAGKRKNLNPFAENVSQMYFPFWVYDQLSEGKEIGMEDASTEERTMVKKMILVALWCIQMKPIDRPSMNKIVEMLEGDSEHLQMPPKPFLYPEESPFHEDQESHTNDLELLLPPETFLYLEERPAQADQGIHANYIELPVMSRNYASSNSLD